MYIYTACTIHVHAIFVTPQSCCIYAFAYTVEETLTVYAEFNETLIVTWSTNIIDPLNIVVIANNTETGKVESKVAETNQGVVLFGIDPTATFIMTVTVMIFGNCGKNSKETVITHIASSASSISSISSITLESSAPSLLTSKKVIPTSMAARLPQASSISESCVQKNDTNGEYSARKEMLFAISIYTEAAVIALSILVSMMVVVLLATLLVLITVRHKKKCFPMMKRSIYSSGDNIEEKSNTEL